MKLTSNLLLAILIPITLLVLNSFIFKLFGTNSLTNIISLLVLMNAPIVGATLLILHSHSLSGKSKIVGFLTAELVTVFTGLLVINSSIRFCASVCPSNIVLIRNIFAAEIFLYLTIAALIPTKIFNLLK